VRHTWLVALLLLGACRCAEGPKPAILQGFDALARPGTTVALRAKLEREGAVGVHPDLHEVSLVYRHEGREVGRATTGDDGIASFEWSVPAAGPADLRVDVSLAEATGYSAAPSTLLVAVRDGTRPMMVCDIDGTIADVSTLKFITSEPEEIPELPGASDVLRGLAERYDVLYLTARDDRFVEQTRRWLALRGFPPGPVFHRDLKLTTLSARRYKTEALEVLKRDWPTIAVGIGDRTEDAEAYLANALVAILVRDEDLPEGALRAASWADVEARVAAVTDGTGR
jgi:phosphatidate phosphatase APP1